MKSIKTIFALVAILTLSFNAKADDYDKVITYSQLPEISQQMLAQHFADKVPMVITMDWDDYTIRYQTGEKIEFDKQGNWKEIECYSSHVPSVLIPEQIKSNVKTSFPGTTIIKIDRNRRGYEIKLNNGLEIEYNREFQVIDIDD